MLASSQLNEAARRVLGLDKVPPVAGLRDRHRANLAIHRDS